MELKSSHPAAKDKVGRLTNFNATYCEYGPRSLSKCHRKSAGLREMAEVPVEEAQNAGFWQVVSLQDAVYELGL
jgi:hypothetical protein